MNLPLIHNTRIHPPPKGHFWTSRRSTIGRMPDDCTLLSLDASLVIPMRVLHFKVSGSPQRTPVRPSWCCSASDLALWLNQGTQQFCGEPEDHVWFEDRWMVASLCDE
jgi:hypothetical protein